MVEERWRGGMVVKKKGQDAMENEGLRTLVRI